MSTTQSSTENSPQNMRAGLSFPPLMATMDTYMDISLNALHLDQGGHGKAARNTKKKAKKNGAAKGKAKSPVVLPKASPRNDLIASAIIRQVASPRSPNNADGPDYHASGRSRIAVDDDDKDNFSLQEMRSPSFPSPPPGGTLQKSGSFASRSAPRGGRLYRENPDIPLSPVNRPASSVVARPEVSFNKALNSIAALKVHNYAMRRRQQQQKKVQLWRDLKSLHQITSEPIKPTPKHQIFEAIAAWKLRYFVENIRLRASRKEIRDLGDLSREKDREIQVLSQLINATQGEISNIVNHQRQQQDVIAQAKMESSSLQQDLSSLRAQLAQAQAQLLEEEQQRLRQENLLEEERRLRSEQTSEMERQGKELELTRRTCQDLILKSIVNETDLKDKGVLMQSHSLAHSTLLQQYQSLVEAHQILLEQVGCLQEDLPQRWGQRVEAQQQIVSSLRAQLDHLAESLSNEQQEHQACRQQLEEVDYQRHKAEEEHHALTKLTADLAVQVQTARQECQETRSQLVSQQASMSTMRAMHEAKLEELCRQIQHLDESLIRTQTSLQASLTTEQSTREQCEEMTRQCTELQQRYQTLETDHLALKNAFLDLHKHSVGLLARTGAAGLGRVSQNLPPEVQRMVETNLIEQQHEREREAQELREKLARETAEREAERAAREIEREEERRERRLLEDKLLALMAKIEDKVDHFESLQQTWLASPATSPHRAASTAGAFGAYPSSNTPPPAGSTALDSGEPDGVRPFTPGTQPTETSGPATARTSFTLSRPLTATSSTGQVLSSAELQEKIQFIEEHIQLENIFHDLQIQLQLLRDEVAQEEHNISLLETEQQHYQQVLDAYFKEFELVYQRPITPSDWDENTLAYKQEIETIAEDIATRRANNDVRDEHIQTIKSESKRLNSDLEENAETFLARYGETIVIYYPADLVATLENLQSSGEAGRRLSQVAPGAASASATATAVASAMAMVNDQHVGSGAGGDGTGGTTTPASKGKKAKEKPAKKTKKKKKAASFMVNDEDAAVRDDDDARRQSDGHRAVSAPQASASKPLSSVEEAEGGSVEGADERDVDRPAVESDGGESSPPSPTVQSMYSLFHIDDQETPAEEGGEGKEESSSVSASIPLSTPGILTTMSTIAEEEGETQTLSNWPSGVVTRLPSEDIEEKRHLFPAVASTSSAAVPASTVLPVAGKRPSPHTVPAQQERSPSPAAASAQPAESRQVVTPDTTVAIRRHSQHTIDDAVRLAMQSLVQPTAPSAPPSSSAAAATTTTQPAEKVAPRETVSPAPLEKVPSDLSRLLLKPVTPRLNTPVLIPTRPLSRQSFSRPSSSSFIITAESREAAPGASSQPSQQSISTPQQQPQQQQPSAQVSLADSSAAPPPGSAAPSEEARARSSQSRTAVRSRGTTVGSSVDLYQMFPNRGIRSREVVSTPATTGASTPTPTPAPAGATSAAPLSPSATPVAITESGKQSIHTPSSQSQPPGSSTRLVRRQKSSALSASGEGGSRYSDSEALPSLEALRAEYGRVRRELKRWRQEFVQQHGREPVVEDYETLDPSIQAKIARRGVLKKQLGEGGGEDD